jgi:hypothetical protein
MKSPGELIAELRGSTCPCGEAKEPWHTFCRRCYYKLSPAQRKALYKKIGDGYEDAYADAMLTLAIHAKGDA